MTAAEEDYQKLCRSPDSGPGTEDHHILPICMGGTDEPDNFVKLFFCNHLLAHELLCRIHPKNETLDFVLREMLKDAPPRWAAGRGIEYSAEEEFKPPSDDWGAPFSGPRFKAIRKPVERYRQGENVDLDNYVVYDARAERYMERRSGWGMEKACLHAERCNLDGIAWLPSYFASAGEE